MKKISLILLVVIGSLSAFAQEKYEPHILILSPKNVKYDPILQHEIDTDNNNLKKMAMLATNAMLAQNGKNADQPQNIKLMQQNGVDFFTARYCY